MNREKKIERQRKRRAEHRKELNEYHRKKYAENRELYRERNHERRAKHQKEYRKARSKRMSGDLNSSGIRKSSIRTKSRNYLFSKHSKLEGYEIHHCFGYDDYKKFIYIPRQLHIDIHQLLRDHKISAESDHWMTIRDMVNSSEEYTYISC